MNSNQSAAFFELRKLHPDHAFTETYTPSEVVIRCSCKKWKQSFTRRQNALSRVSKQNAAERAHLMSLPLPAKPVMDDFTENHLRAWLESTVMEDEREQVEKLIRDFVTEHPDVLERNGWPEIRMLAERQEALRG